MEFKAKCKSAQGRLTGPGDVVSRHEGRLTFALPEEKGIPGAHGEIHLANLAEPLALGGEYVVTITRAP